MSGSLSVVRAGGADPVRRRGGGPRRSGDPTQRERGAGRRADDDHAHYGAGHEHHDHRGRRSVVVDHDDHVEAPRGFGGATTTTTVAPGTVSVVVANGTQTNGLAAHYLDRHRRQRLEDGNARRRVPTSEATSAVYYAPGFQQQAAAIATAIGLKPSQVLPLTSAVPVSGVTGTDVVVVIGQDLSSTTTTTVASS